MNEEMKVWLEKYKGELTKQFMQVNTEPFSQFCQNQYVAAKQFPVETKEEKVAE